MNKYEGWFCVLKTRSQSKSVSTPEEPKRLGSETEAGIDKLQNTMRKAKQWQARVWGTHRGVWYTQQWPLRDVHDLIPKHDSEDVMKS